MPDEPNLPIPAETTEVQLDESALPSDDRRYAAAKLTDTLPASAYAGAATLELNRDQEAILDEPTPDNEIDIRPDGLIYISHEFVRRQLNRAFGRLQWALIPGSPLVAEGQDLYQRWVLLIQGTYVSEAFASRRYFANGNQTRDDVAEAIKSDCLRRCCKDLGIGLDAWNKRRAETWRRQFATQVLVTTNQGNKNQWRRADADPLNGEIKRPQPQPDNAPPAAPSVQAKPMEVVGDKGRSDLQAPATAPKEHVAPPPPSTPPKTGPRAVPKPAPAPVKSAGPATSPLRLTDGQLRLLWVRATGAGLVVADDASGWIQFLNETCLVPLPDSTGKTSKEIAAAMMRSLPAGTHFQKLLKTLEIQAQQNQVEI